MQAVGFIFAASPDGIRRQTAQRPRSGRARAPTWRDRPVMSNHVRLADHGRFSEKPPQTFVNL
eukprot:scaffold146463_cov27-Prasinocladus_malaysianus.AAC.2